MCESTTIIKNINGDRIVKISILEHNYFAFTISHRTLVVIEHEVDGRIILFCNRKYPNHIALDKGFDKFIADVTKAKNIDEIMDTYIELSDTSIQNETTKEILGTFNFVIEAFK